MRAQQLECRDGWVVTNLLAVVGRAKDGTSQLLPTSSPAKTRPAAPGQETAVTPAMRGSWQPRATPTCSRYMREPSAAVACQVSPKIGLKGFAHRVKARWKPAACSTCSSGIGAWHVLWGAWQSQDHTDQQCRITSASLQHSVNQITRPLACTRCFTALPPETAPCSTPAMKYVTTHCSRSTGSFDWAASCRTRGYTWCSRGSITTRRDWKPGGLRRARWMQNPAIVSAQAFGRQQPQHTGSGTGSSDMRHE